MSVVPETSLRVDEGGADGSYTVVLASEPSGNVTVTATSGDLDAVTVSPMSLTFTTGNWATAQTVTVTAVDDTDANDEDVDVSHRAASTDSAYNNLAGDVVTVTVTDDDTAGVTVVPETSLRVDEGGADGSYTVVLASEPSGNVTVTATSGDLDAVTVSPMSLTFTTGNWATAQTVTVTAVDDTDANDEDVDVSHRAASTDSAYNNLAGDVVTVTVDDDDTAGVTVVPETSLRVDEGGADGSYTVVLASEPSGNVTVTATSGDLDAVTVTPTVLTFTTGNWATAQTVTVTAVDDTDANDEDVDVSHRAASTDSAYNNLAGDVVTVTVTDDEVAGVTIVLAASLMSPVGEGGTGTYTVVLASEPSETVTVTATSGDLDAVTVTPTVLTFTTGNWATAQTVTVHAEQDNDAGDETVDVSHTAASTDTAYNLTGDVVTVTVTDDEGVTIVLAASLMSPVGEGGTGTYTVVLASEPSETVTVTATSGDLDAVTVTPTVLTFTTGNWATAQTVTVTAEQDNNAVDETVDVSHTAASTDTAYNLTGDVVTVTVTDDEVAGVTIVLAASLMSPVGEGGTGTYTVVLASEPSETVTVTATSGNTGAVTVTPTVLTFTPGNWATAQTVTVTAEQDNNAVDETVDVSHTLTSADDAAYNLTGDVVTVTVTDDEVAGVTIVLAASLMSPVGEGGTGTYTVVLASEPSETVTVTATSGDLDAVTVTPTVLTFTTGNWATAQTVTVTAEQDNNAVDETVDVSHTLTSADDTAYNLTGDVVTVTVDDDDEVAAVSVSFGASAYSVSEGGTTAAVTVELSAFPGRQVVVPITVTKQGDTSAGDYTTVPAAVTFAADVTEQSFTFAAVDDRVDDDGESVVLSFGELPSGVSTGEPSTATVTIADNDTAGVTVVPDTGLSFDEDGTATYTVVLDSQPTGDVTVTISVVSGATLASYTPSLISGATRASYTPSLISGATRASYTPSLISGATRASYTPSLISGATRAWYTPVAADVTKFLKAFVSPDAVTVSPSVLTFTSTNWDTPQTVTVRAMDGIVTDDETIEVSHTVTSADGGYDDFAAAKQTVRTAPLEVDPALSVGRLGLFWDNSTTGNTLWGDSCIGRRSFFVIWTGPEGNNKRADEWAAEISTHRGAGQVIYDFRETPRTPGYYEMYGTVDFQGTGSLSLNVRGRFGQRWGTWSPTGSLHCFEVQRPTRD